MSFKRQRIVPGVGIALLLMAGALTISTIPCLNHRHDFECSFERLPRDDDALVDWLERQPGIIAHSVLVYRREEEPVVLMVSLSIVQNVWKQPSLPDMDQACVELKYHTSAGLGFCPLPRD